MDTTLHEVVGAARHIQEEGEAVRPIMEAAGEEVTLVVTPLHGHLIPTATPTGEAEEEEETQEVAVDHLPRTMNLGLQLLTVIYPLRLRRN